MLRWIRGMMAKRRMLWNYCPAAAMMIDIFYGIVFGYLILGIGFVLVRFLGYQ